ncbi:MAG: aldehyde dehydrogenase [Bacteroidetes bacterium]|nr:MAG: aldehyde dehydrogenase [Bacteroidota bacterium]
MVAIPHHQLSLSQPEIDDLFASQKQFFASGVTRTLQFRQGMLATLKKAIQRHEQDILAALSKDLGNPAFEAYGKEVGLLYAEIDHTLKHLRSWMQPERVPTPLLFFPSKSVIYSDPLGVTLIIAPWNYPAMLSLSPLIAAIAGGNTSIVKLSEMATHTAVLLTKMLTECFEEQYIAVLNGPGHFLGEMLIERHHLDHVFFTGSSTVGKKILASAAKQLTPVTLELGGKSPCIVAADANLEHAAKKIVWSKTLNTGQTCVAPDYLLVHRSVKTQLVEKIKAALVRQYGDNPAHSPDYGRIINAQRLDVLESYLTQGQVIFGGQVIKSELYMAPTLLEGMAPDSPVMTEEIFGPLLPILVYDTLEEAEAWVQRNPYPLALYVYTQSDETAKFFTERLQFGGGCINNSLVHLGNSNLPFGGVGSSGMGQYHGHEGFRTFTRRKSVQTTSTWFDLPLWYPPYKNNIRWLRKYFG